MTGGLGAELAEPLEGTEIDVEVPMDVVGHRNDILSFFWKLRGDGIVGFLGSFHGSMIDGGHFGPFDFWRSIVAVVAREELPLLGEDSVAVEIAIDAEVSEDFKGEAGVFESAGRFVAPIFARGSGNLKKASELFFRKLTAIFL